MDADSRPPSKRLDYGLALGALGVVYGDIGTSPLYSIKECFHGVHAIPPTPENILGVLSLVVWSLTIVVTIKYLTFIMKADNRGEGGIFALLALVPGSNRIISPRLKSGIVFGAIVGASLLYGDGFITPSISVLSAIEGLNVATDAAERFVVPLTCAILFGLFLVQRRGTAGIGKIFGPVMLIWFAALAMLGLRHIIMTPQVLVSINPYYGFEFFAANRFHGLVVLASVVLCITGGEALYADMGHFGQKPIRISWFTLVFPALLLNYLGQGALLLSFPEHTVNPFYGLVPRAFLYPMVLLSTLATVIASQAMISGAFSLTRQAVQMGYCPRVTIVHTSAETEGQIYIPEVNRMMMIICIGLVLVFKESGRLAGAYGVAVTANMAITSMVYYYVATRTWGWSLKKTLPLVLLFLFFDLTYFGSNLLKFFDGGWFTMAIAAVLVIIMTSWKDGRAELYRRIIDSSLPMPMFLQDVSERKLHRVAGTAVFMASTSQLTPPSLLHHVKHNKVLHEKVILLTITSSDVPTVKDENRIQVEYMGEGFYRLIANFGFMETPNVPQLVEEAYASGLIPNCPPISYYLGRETLILMDDSTRMLRWRKLLFAFLSRNSRSATGYFGLPPGQVVEVGVQMPF